MTAAQRLLQKQATDLLRQSGYTWSGRFRKEVSCEQCAFERQFVKIPTNGKATRKRHS